MQWLLGDRKFVKDPPVAKYTGVVTVGSASVSEDGILSGLTGGSYGRLPFSVSLQGLAWEVNVKCDYVGESGAGGVIGIGSGNGWCPIFYNNMRGVSSYLNQVQWPVLWDTYSGSSSYLAVDIPTGKHSVKVSFDKSKYRFFLDGVLKAEKASTAKCYCDHVQYHALGGNRGNDKFPGTFDLKECYIVIGDELMWEGVAGAYTRAGGDSL